MTELGTCSPIGDVHVDTMDTQVVNIMEMQVPDTPVRTSSGLSDSVEVKRLKFQGQCDTSPTTTMMMSPQQASCSPLQSPPPASELPAIAVKEALLGARGS